MQGIYSLVLACDTESFTVHTLLFLSPELKAQVSFFDHQSSVVCLSISSSSPEPLISTIHLVEGIQMYSNEGPGPFPRGDNYEIA